MKDLLFFDEMVTPKIITVVYWLSLIVIVLCALTNIFTNFSFIGLIASLLGVVLGAIMTRIWCEVMIVLFKINDNIKILADKEQAE